MPFKILASHVSDSVDGEIVLYLFRTSSPHERLTTSTRICPGQPFANDVLFTLVASILHTFDITTEFDANGKPIPAELEFVPAGITYVMTFIPMLPLL